MLKFQIALFPELDITKNHQINRNSKIKHYKVKQPSANIFNYVSGIIIIIYLLFRTFWYDFRCLLFIEYCMLPHVMSFYRMFEREGTS